MTDTHKSGCPIHAQFFAGCEYCQQINDMLDEQFADALQKRHMSDWSDAELHRYSVVTAQECSCTQCEQQVHPDFGGAYDGVRVTSDADGGL